MNIINCPKCCGKKQTYHRCFPTQLSGWKPCETCDATGTISEIKEAMLEIGRDIKQKRIKLRVLTRDIAATNNFTLGKWSDIEQGRNTLENAYRARAIVEALADRSKVKFDVCLWISSAKTPEQFSFDTKAEAENHR